MLVSVPCFHSYEEVAECISSLGWAPNSTPISSISYAIGHEFDTCTLEFSDQRVTLQGNSSGWFTTIHGKSQVLDGSAVTSLWSWLQPNFPLSEVASAVWTSETPLRIYVCLLRDYIAVPMPISTQSDWGIENIHRRGSYIVASPYESRVETIEMDLPKVEKLFGSSLRDNTHQIRVTDDNRLRVESLHSDYPGGFYNWTVKGNADRLLKKLGVPGGVHVEGWIHYDIGYWLVIHGPVQVCTYEVPGELRSSC